MKTVNFHGTICNVEITTYPASKGRKAIVLKDIHDGSMFATATVNMPELDDDVPMDYVFIKDYSENEGMTDVLVDAGIISVAGFAESGHVIIPVCELLVEEKS